ncbi:TatD family hydrolase [Spirochaetia bacterium]|nr:TatD family hydrolase [Spirochaetia bacterium]
MMIDTHAHLSLLEKRGIKSHETLRGLFAEGLVGIIDISLEPGDLAGRIAEFSVYPGVRFASGLWPHAASIERRRELVPALEQDIRAAPQGLVRALGEFGLDHHWNGEDHVPGAVGSRDLEGERELMEMQLDLARRLALPVIIHSRDAPDETADILAPYRDVPGIIHCFSYGPEEVQNFLTMGYFISFAGNLTYKNAHNIRDACKAVPKDRLLLETDCPYLAPVPFRGKPAHPGMVAEVYKLASEIRGEDLDVMAAQIAENVKTLFGMDMTALR